MFNQAQRRQIDKLRNQVINHSLGIREKSNTKIYLILIVIAVIFCIALYFNLKPDLSSEVKWKGSQLFSQQRRTSNLNIKYFVKPTVEDELSFSEKEIEDAFISFTQENCQKELIEQKRLEFILQNDASQKQQMLKSLGKLKMQSCKAYNKWDRSVVNIKEYPRVEQDL